MYLLNGRLKNLDIQSKKIEEDKRENSEHTLSYGGSIGTSGIGLNYEKDGNGFSIGTTLEGKLTNTSLKLGNEDYDLNGDLIYKENRDNLVNDVKNVINTPRAYVRAIDTLNVENADFFKEAQKEIFENNLNTETGLEVQRYKELIDKATSDEEKVEIVKSYYRQIGLLGGKEFKNIVFVENRVNEKGEIVYASTDKDDNLYINKNNVDILDLKNMKPLISYETKRWKYDDKEVDTNTLHYNQDEREDVKLDYTKIDVDSIELTNDEMRELRNYTYVPVYNDADRKKLYDSLTKEQKNKLKRLTQKQVKNILNNILYRDKIEGKRINDRY